MLDGCLLGCVVEDVYTDVWEDGGIRERTMGCETRPFTFPRNLDRPTEYAHAQFSPPRKILRY